MIIIFHSILEETNLFSINELFKPVSTFSVFLRSLIYLFFIKFNLCVNTLVDEIIVYLVYLSHRDNVIAFYNSSFRIVHNALHETLDC